MTSSPLSAPPPKVTTAASVGSALFFKVYILSKPHLFSLLSLHLFVIQKNVVLLQ